jgi:hypothetical protein
MSGIPRALVDADAVARAIERAADCFEERVRIDGKQADLAELDAARVEVVKAFAGAVADELRGLASTIIACHSCGAVVVGRALGDDAHDAERCAEP